jgi:hypothetical protein
MGKAEVTPEHAASALFALLDEEGQTIVLDSGGQLPVEDEISEDLIPIKDWAKNHGLSPATVRQKAGRGAFRTARKIGRDWFISASEPNPDHRMRIEAKDRLAISGPVGIREILHYLRVLNAGTLPAMWHRDHDHASYCRKIFFKLREKLSGNTRILFDLLIDSMEEQREDPVIYLPHIRVMAELDDEAWVTSNQGSSKDAGITIDFADYLHVLGNTASDLLGQVMKLKINHNSQTMIVSWYHSLSWKETQDDGIYFVPSDFFKIIVDGLS